MGKDTFQLFDSLPSFREGVARVLDVSGQLVDLGYIISATPADADVRASASDWASINSDMNAVIAKSDGAKP